MPTFPTAGGKPKSHPSYESLNLMTKNNKKTLRTFLLKSKTKKINKHQSYIRWFPTSHLGSPTVIHILGHPWKSSPAITITIPIKPREMAICGETRSLGVIRESSVPSLGGWHFVAGRRFDFVFFEREKIR